MNRTQTRSFSAVTWFHHGDPIAEMRGVDAPWSILTEIITAFFFTAYHGTLPLDYFRHPPPPLFQCHRSIVSFSSSLRSSCIIGYGSTFNKLGRLLPMYQSYPSLAPQATMDVTRPYIGVYSSGNTQRYLSNTSRVISHVPGCFIQKVRKTTFSKVHEQKLERTDQVSLLTSCPRLWNAR